MRVRVLKGFLPDRVVVEFWIGAERQAVVMSYTELGEIMEENDVKTLMATPLGVWKAICSMKLRV